MKKIFTIALVATALTGVFGTSVGACEYHVGQDIILNCGDPNCNSLTWIY